MAKRANQVDDLLERFDRSELAETKAQQEIWKVIDGFNNYSISNLGHIKNNVRGNLLHPSKNGSGYYYVSLPDSASGKEHMKRLHVLVAEAFVPENGKKRNMVNHIDGDKGNNKASNLEWCTSKENTDHAVGNGLFNTNPVVQLSADGKIVGIYHSTRDAAAQTGLDYSTISKVIRNDYGHNHCGGFKWVLAKELCGRKLVDEI